MESADHQEGLSTRGMQVLRESFCVRACACVFRSLFWMVIEMRAVLECPLWEKVMNANECETGLRGRDPTESLKTLRESCPRECPTFRRKEECVCLFRTYCLQNGATSISHCRSKHSIITLQLHSGFYISHLPLFVCISGFSSRFLWFCIFSVSNSD